MDLPKDDDIKILMDGLAAKIGAEYIAQAAAMELIKEDLIDPTGPPLTPSYHGRECLGNGHNGGYECCCDNCDHFLFCFPEFK